MGHGFLLPDTGEVSLEYLKGSAPGRIVMVLRTKRIAAICPRCGTASRRVHSHYLRRLADLPWEGISVCIELRTRRFFCVRSECSQRIFGERLPATAPRYERRTSRLSQAFGILGMALGGRAGARLAKELGLGTSRDSLLRQLRRKGPPVSPEASPRVLGIDDWAWRKGHRYGTIVCDLERGKVVDLLPDRDSETVQRWLEAHPGAEVISRDRASAYAEAARKAAPGAVQVADRWHLLHNLSEALQQALAPKHALLTQAARAVTLQTVDPELVERKLEDARSPAIKQQSEARRGRRLARYEAVMELVSKGISQAEIARTLAIDRRTIRRWSRAGAFPERKTGQRNHALDRYANYLERRWQEGCRNATQLWRELREQGFRRGGRLVRQWIRQHYGSRSRPGVQKIKAPTPLLSASPRTTAWWLLTQPVEARDYLDQLCQRSPEIAYCAEVAREFVRMIRERDAAAWPRWLKAAKSSLLARFATHLARDGDAVLAALTLPWSNGPVEGQVHRLKLIKRQMYGRANFDLLRLRVLTA